jgi:hypothetical protein
VEEPELHNAARSLKAGAGQVLLDEADAITRSADLFQDQGTKGLFLFECAAGILMSLAGGNTSLVHATGLRRALEVLRSDYERLLGVTIANPPSCAPTHLAGRAMRLADARKRREVLEAAMVSFIVQPLSEWVSERLREALGVLSQADRSLLEQSLPCIVPDDQRKFQESVGRMCGWINSLARNVRNASPHGADPMFAELVELRALAEEGRAGEALERTARLASTLDESRKQALAPFFRELSWSALGDIERELIQGQAQKAKSLADSAAALVGGTPLEPELSGLLQDLFRREARESEPTPPACPSAALASEAEGPRARQAAILLRDHAEELDLAENGLEHAFLQAVLQGSDASFRRKEKLKHRLRIRTRWGGREPYKTILRLLDTVGGPSAA